MNYVFIHNNRSIHYKLKSNSNNTGFKACISLVMVIPEINAFQTKFSYLETGKYIRVRYSKAKLIGSEFRQVII